MSIIELQIEMNSFCRLVEGEINSAPLPFVEKFYGLIDKISAFGCKFVSFERGLAKLETQVVVS